MEAAARPSAIRWRPWGQEAFADAERLGRPVLLRLSASWCHWCRVMEAGTDADPRVAALVEEAFVPVWVDIDKAPPLRDRYAQGGYPTSAVLTPRGEVLASAAYLPASEFLRLLDGGLAAHGRSAVSARSQACAQPPQAAPPRGTQPQALSALGASVLDEYDWKNHGFGFEPKFPQAPAIEFLLALGLRTGTPLALKAARLSLSAMAKGELHDPVDGGFFRCCERARWQEPHFEKMLEGNAQLLQAYAVAAGWTNDGGLRATALETAAYIDRVLSDPDGHLWVGSQASDEEYYGKMAHRRGAHGAPSVDRAVYTGWAAAGVSAFARAGLCLDETRLIARAKIAMDELLTSGAVQGDAVRHYRDEAGWHGGGLLQDHVGLAAAALDVYCATGQRPWLDRSAALAGAMVAHFEDPKDGALFDFRGAPEVTGPAAVLPQKSLSENGAAAALLLRLAAATGRDDLDARAKQILGALSREAAPFGVRAAPFGTALLASTGGVIKVTTGPWKMEGPAGRTMRAALAAAFAVGPAVLVGDDAQAGSASFCVGERCSARVSEPREVKAALASVVPLHEKI